MNTKEIKELLAQFDESKLTEIEIKQAEFQLYMNKNQTATRGYRDSSEVATGSSVAKVEENQTVAHEIINTTESTFVEVEDSEVISSPIVGVVYLKPAPEKDQFKQVGDTVKKGEVVCIVEAMKVMNEITSPFDGVISEIVVENEAIVEYHQPIFKVKI